MSDYRMPFGQFKGLRIEDLPDDYLAWLLSLENLRQRLLGHVQREDARRAEVRRVYSLSAEALAMADAMVRSGYREQTRKHHPDAGGTHESMTAVTQAADFLRGALEAARVRR